MDLTVVCFNFTPLNNRPPSLAYSLINYPVLRRANEMKIVMETRPFFYVNRRFLLLAAIKNV